MTCAEVQKLVTDSIGKGGPMGVTRAERKAVYNHAQSCSKCMSWVCKKGEEAAARNPPIMGVIAALQADAIHEADAFDQET